MKRILIAGSLVALAMTNSAGAADLLTRYQTDASFEDVAFAVESAIVDRGLVIDYVSHVGEMLSRTAADVGGAKDLFVEADIYLFCSAKLSRQAMEQDLANIANCPYGIYVYHSADAPELVTVGYRNVTTPGMEAVQELLDEIAREATE